MCSSSAYRCDRLVIRGYIITLKKSQFHGCHYDFMCRDTFILFLRFMTKVLIWYFPLLFLPLRFDWLSARGESNHFLLYLNAVLFRFWLIGTLTEAYTASLIVLHVTAEYLSLFSGFASQHPQVCSYWQIACCLIQFLFSCNISRSFNSRPSLLYSPARSSSSQWRNDWIIRQRDINSSFSSRCHSLILFKFKV